MGELKKGAKLSICAYVSIYMFLFICFYSYVSIYMVLISLSGRCSQRWRAPLRSVTSFAMEEARRKRQFVFYPLPIQAAC